MSYHQKQIQTLITKEPKLPKTRFGRSQNKSRSKVTFEVILRRLTLVDVALILHTAEEEKGSEVRALLEDQAKN